jgi:prepilin-type N-terminal cleavage/methylation domain-containing protein
MTEKGESRDMRGSLGFTLIEVLLSILILGLSAAAITEVYSSGLRALEVRVTEGQLDSVLRSQMELLLAQKFTKLTSGSQAVTVEGQSYTIKWTIANIDLDGDLAPEPGAKQITVTLDNKSLVTIVSDSAGSIGKI